MRINSTFWLTITLRGVSFNHMVNNQTADLDRVFHALSDPTRRALLASLQHGERTVTELARPHSISLTAVSKHLGVLERASLVTRLRSGRQVRCRLEPAPLAAASEWIEHYRNFWTLRLDSLDDLLRTKEDTTDEREA